MKIFLMFEGLGECATKIKDVLNNYISAKYWFCLMA